jgi:hypothetical protein
MNEEAKSKRCSRCRADLPADDFYLRKDKNGVRRYLDPWCKTCRNAANKKRRTERPDVHRAGVIAWKKRNADRTKEINNSSRRRSHERRRRLLIEAYGGKCACCGEDDPHFLTIDHVDGRSPEHQKLSGMQLTSRLEIEGYPDTCQLLCWNCNCAKGRYGTCPHNADFVPYYA